MTNAVAKVALSTCLLSIPYLCEVDGVDTT